MMSAIFTVTMKIAKYGNLTNFEGYNEYGFLHAQTGHKASLCAIRAAESWSVKKIMIINVF